MKEITAIRFTVEHKRISVLTKSVVIRLFQRLQALFCATDVSAEHRRALPVHYRVSQLLPFRKLTPSDRIDQYFLSCLPMPLSYWLGGVCFLCRDLRSSSFALMEMLVFSSREIVQLVLALTVALMKSLCFAWGTSARRSGRTPLTVQPTGNCSMVYAILRIAQTRRVLLLFLQVYGFADSYPVRAWNCGTCGTSSPLLKH